MSVQTEGRVLETNIMSHYRLPSFNELTSKFSNNLQLDSSTHSSETSTVNSSQLTPQVLEANQPPKISSGMKTAIPSTSNEARPLAPHQPPPILSQQFRLQQHPVHQPPPPPPPQTQQHVHHQPPQAQQFGPPSMPPRYPIEMSRFQFPPPEPNYVITHTAPPPHFISAPGSAHPQALPSFDHDRRLSMQYPPYPSKHQLNQPSNPQHSKKDSYDSQTSLSTLADIASENDFKNDELKEFVHSLETIMDKFRDIAQIFSDLQYDFIQHVEQSNNVSVADDIRFKLMYEYTGSDNKPLREVSMEYLETFMKNIPLVALRKTAEEIDYIQNILSKWVEYRVRDDVQRKKKEEEEKKRRDKTIDQHLASPRPKFLKAHSRQNSKRNIRLPERHQRHQSLSGTNTANPINSKTENSDKGEVMDLSSAKRRRSNSSSKRPTITKSTSSSHLLAMSKEENVSLVVKPPKPVTDIDITQTQAMKGNYNEDLSPVKVDNKCQQCGSDETPEWRRGPYGSRSLCNACGLFYGKLIKKFGYEDAAKIMRKRKEQGNGDDRRIPID